MIVGGEADSDGDNIVSHRATSAEAAQGYVEVLSTGGSYIYGVKVVQVSMIQEKQLYSTKFLRLEEGRCFNQRIKGRAEDQIQQGGFDIYFI